MVLIPERPEENRYKVFVLSSASAINSSASPAAAEAALPTSSALPTAPRTAALVALLAKGQASH